MGEYFFNPVDVYVIDKNRKTYYKFDNIKNFSLSVDKTMYDTEYSVDFATVTPPLIKQVDSENEIKEEEFEKILFGDGEENG